MTNLQDALFPPLDDVDDDEVENNPREQQIYSLLHSIKADPQPDDALTAAVLIQREIDRWKQSIQELECRLDSAGTDGAKEGTHVVPVVADEDEVMTESDAVSNLSSAVSASADTDTHSNTMEEGEGK